MWNPPALCRNCGKLSNSSSLSLQGIAKVVITNSTAPCPFCGGITDILDGTYSGVGEILTLLSGPQTTIDILRRASQVVKDSQAVGETIDKTVERVSEVLPGFEAFKTKAGKGAINLVIWLLGVVAGEELIKPASDYVLGRESPPTISQMRDIMKEEINNALIEDRKKREGTDLKRSYIQNKNNPFPKSMKKLQDDWNHRYGGKISKHQ